MASVAAALSSFGHEARRWAYWDRAGGIENTVFLAGSGRSGTTWVEEVLNRHGDHRVLFEPFFADRVPAARLFPRGLYLAPDEQDRPRHAAAERILTGRVHDRWIDHHNRAVLPKKRLVKDIRANLWLGWATRNWPQMPVVYLVRHPIAVAASALRLGWADGLDLLLEQPKLIDEHLTSAQVTTLRRLDDGLARFVARWCVENVVAFRTLGPDRAALIVYEELVERPNDEATRLLSAVGQTPDAALEQALAKPSRLSRSRAGDALSTPATHTVAMQVIEDMGLGAAYPGADSVDADALHGLWRQMSADT